MYFINNEDIPEEKSKFLPKPEIVSKSEILPELEVEPKLKIILPPELPTSTNDNTIHQLVSNDAGKRVYGRARANLCFSSFYIFCEDFRKQLSYLYPHKSETYHKTM
ncbi:unnamed protein product [Macrosiphum euphorbiae]|uniref:Uncharacterized protein n=1 Tax=Macrosiphum euphorbiae TaxID=13131 RepID=A0AAV0VFH3_9HEMI|nr:unnamed protein product [Macrosiphum euphorbiae]